MGATGPAARRAHSFSYGTARESLVLAAGVGQDGDILWDETWRFRPGVGWTEAERETPLPPSAYLGALYDETDQVVILLQDRTTRSYR